MTGCDGLVKGWDATHHGGRCWFTEVHEENVMGDEFRLTKMKTQSGFVIIMY